MIYNTDYTNCKVLIRDNTTGETIAQTKIVEFNKRQLSIIIDAREFVDNLNNKRLLLLIFTSDAIHHFGGVARKSYTPRRVEISMFQGKEQDDRSAKRYPANVNATIKDIFFTEDNESVDKELPVKLLNLSTNGVLIETEFDELEPNDTFTLYLNIANSPTLIKCTVVRHIENEGIVKYGCKFLAIENN